METIIRPATDTLSWERALELAVASRFVYWPPGLAEEKLRKWGYSKVQVIDKEHLRFLAAANSKRLIVAFRGSQNWSNWFTNLAFCGEKESNLGPVHPGFLDAFRVLKSHVWAAIEKLDPAGSKELWITGHSLGGALATLAAAEYQFKDRIKGVYTFGQPRTGYEEFRARFDTLFNGRMFRFVYKDDPVARVPCVTYAHTGRMVWLKGEGKFAIISEGDVRFRGTEDAPPEPFTEAKMVAAQADVNRAMQQETRGVSVLEGEEANAEDGNLDAARGASLPVDNHRTARYIAAVEEQVNRPASETRLPSAPPAPKPTLAVPGASAPVGASVLENLAPVNLVHLPPPPPSDPSASGAASVVPEQVWEQLPPLAVHVVWSPQSGNATLCPNVAKSIFESLGHGLGLTPDVESSVGIPVYAGHHFAWLQRMIDRLSSPRRSDSKLVVAVLLDEASKKDLNFRSVVERLLKSKDSQGFRANILFLPVLVDDAWKTSVPADLTRIETGTEPQSLEDKLNEIRWQVAVETARFLMRVRGTPPRSAAPQPSPGAEKVRVFISYARADEEYSGGLAGYLSQNPGKRMSTFFDVRNIAWNDSLSQELRDIQSNAVTLMVRTDNYSLSPYCQEEVLNAKQAGIPLVSLYVLKDGRGRSFPYEANSLTLCARLPLDEKARAELAERCGWVCLKAWLHHLHFHHAANVIYRRRSIGLPAQFLSRPPELLDFVEGPVRGDSAGIVLYADPPLSIRETDLIRRAYPRVRLATPTTLSRETVSRVPSPPLDGLRVALALSSSSDLAENFEAIPPSAATSGAGGLLTHHLSGATEYLALSLIRAGAELGYGARLNPESYIPLLAHLVSAHRRVQKSSEQLLHSYLAHHYPDSDGYPGNRIRVDAVPGIEQLPKRAQEALHLSLMRLWMARDQQKNGGTIRSCGARVVLGGRTQPQLGAERTRFDYTGRFPGQAEEAFQHLAAKKPVYVAGGFLGSAGQVALALCNELDKLPKEADWKRQSEEYRTFCEAYDKHRPATLAGLPASLDDFWKALAEFGKGYFWGEDAAENKVWTNGLTVAENRALFVSYQYDQISALVVRGLSQVARGNTALPDAPLKIALYQGSIANALDVEAYAVLILGSSRLRGADAALDAKVNGLLQSTLENRTGRFDQIIPVRSGQLSGDYILPYWIDNLQTMASDPKGEVDWLKRRIREGLDSIVRRASENRIRSLAIVPLGSNLGLDVCDSAKLIIDSILQSQVQGRVESIALCEIDPERYIRVREFLFGQSKNNSRLSVTELPAQLTPVLLPSFFLQFQQKDRQRGKRPGKISQLARGPRSAGTVPISDQDIDWNQVGATFAGEGGSPPAFQEHEKLGTWLAENVLAPGLAKAAVTEGLALPWDVLLDVPCSAIPFEMLCFRPPGSENPVRPALIRGIRRGLLLGNQPYHATPMTRNCYRALIISNPTGDLKGTIAETDRIEHRLREAFGNPNAVPRIELQLICGKDATTQRVLDEISSGRYDFIHYAGHGNFDPDRPDKSGLKLSNGFLRANDLQKSLAGISKSRKKTDAGNDEPHPPLLVILNACLSGRMNSVNQISLAQVILQTGVGGFLGNRWNVGDKAAQDFAVSIYSDLVSGITLGEAICRARQQLFDQQSPDWCNYSFYGSPEIRL